LAPVTMIAALTVLVLGGGFGGLSALGQLFTGPGVPGGVPLPGARVASRTPVPVLPVVPARPPATAGPVRVAATTPPVVHVRAPSAPARHRQHPTGIGTGRGTTPPVRKPPLPPTKKPPPPKPPPPTPTPGPVATVVNSVVSTGEDLTNQLLPPSLATPVNGILSSTGQTLNKILSP
jgi:hypothetical protein